MSKFRRIGCVAGRFIPFPGRTSLRRTVRPSIPVLALSARAFSTSASFNHLFEPSLAGIEQSIARGARADACASTLSLIEALYTRYTAIAPATAEENPGIHIHCSANGKLTVARKTTESPPAREQRRKKILRLINEGLRRPGPTEQIVVEKGGDNQTSPVRLSVVSSESDENSAQETSAATTVPDSQLHSLLEMTARVVNVCLSECIPLDTQTLSYVLEMFGGPCGSYEVASSLYTSARQRLGISDTLTVNTAMVKCACVHIVPEAAMSHFNELVNQNHLTDEVTTQYRLL